MALQTPAAVLEAYRAAVHDRNVEGFLRLYDPAARVYDTWGVWSYDGTDSRRKAIENWFGSLGEECVQVSFDDVQITEHPGLALLTATGRFAAVSSAGLELRSMQNRLTWTLLRQAEQWRVLHEHSSVPIGGSDLKGILHRSEA
jgi:ketosteroid isomerase-like protein